MNAARQMVDDILTATLQHRQGGRSDGSWGCACGWVQDKPHREHLIDVALRGLVVLCDRCESEVPA